MIKRKKVTGNGIAKVLLFYWVVLVAWQNIGGTEARSGMDVLLKIGLLGLLTVFYCLHAKHVSRNILALLLFAICMVMTFGCADETISAGTLIGYMYPILLAFLVFGIGNDFQITKRELRFFLKGVIVVASYAALYAVFFRREDFQAALRMQVAYGNEMSSFFISSHEYGMYLLFAVVACIICAEMDKGKKAITKIGYFLVAAFLGLNVILTFSRTTIVALVVVVVVHCVFNTDRKTRKWLWMLAAAGIFVLMTSKAAQETIEFLLFKGRDAGDFGDRGDLAAVAVDLFRESPFLNKIFGHGYGVREVFESYAGHGSVHNAYLQVLLYFGIIGITFMGIVLGSQLRDNISLYKVEKFYSVTFLAMLLAGVAVMVTNTAIIFTSPIDSYFLTVVAIVVPKYVCNSIRAGTFDASNNIETGKC